MKHWKTITHNVQLCIVGGGMAGLISAIAAARKGTKVALIQDRPMLGGNASSEIRMQVRGAHGKENKETGILSEIELEAIYRNPTLNPSIWDSILFEKVKAEKNITLLLNTSCIDLEKDGDKISSAKAWQLTTYSWHVIHAELFVDSSGDSVLSVPSGAEYRLGREASSEFNESMGVEVADTKTMGMSILIQTRETDKPVPFIPPSWAYKYEDESFATIAYDEYHSSHRDHALGTNGVNFWWIELGGNQNVLDDAENIRDELLKTAYGVWDHIKNHGDHGAENWELDWVGFLPGKRESRRYVGPYILTQNDIQENKHFEDIIAYGEWPLDDHNPMGFLNRGEAHEKSQFLPTPSPYGIPFRVLYSKNVPNLMFVGRNISATHAAFSSTRVMGTCSILGQAAGTAAAICLQNSLLPGQMDQKLIKQLQDTLVEDYCFIPGLERLVPELSKTASLNITQAERDRLFDGVERMTADEKEHRLFFSSGDKLSFKWDNPTMVQTLRIVFDPDFSRDSITKFSRFQLFAMRSHVGKDFIPVSMPMNLGREFIVEVERSAGKWEQVAHCTENHKDLWRLKINEEVLGIKITFVKSWSESTTNIYACEVF